MIGFNQVVRCNSTCCVAQCGRPAATLDGALVVFNLSMMALSIRAENANCHLV